MIFQRYYLGCLSHASYLIADERTKTAVVVDPQRDVDQYLADAGKLGATIRHVFLTHFHADFVAGHLELAKRTGALVHLGARARAEYAFVPAREGEPLELGDVRLEFLETPGHTPEGVCIVVYDLAKDRARPHAVLTGDTLFIGDVGRPDLMASVGVTAHELASDLYESLHGKLLKLPDETLVYPAHGAGSACGKSLSKETVSTIGAQRASNYALRPMTKAQFVEMATSGLPEAPRYFGFDAQLNRSARGTLEDSLARALRPMSVEEVLALRSQGGVVLDTRDPDVFAPRHLRGSVNIGLGGKFASWVGALLDPAVPIALVAEPGRETESAMRLGRVGFDRVAGYLEGGVAALARRPDLLAAFERIDAPELAARLSRADAPRLLDVRAPSEHEAARIAGAQNLPLEKLEQRLSEIPSGAALAIHCAGGYRSTIAASLLERAGFRGLIDLRGGFGGWQGAGLPVELPAPRAGAPARS